MFNRFNVLLVAFLFIQAFTSAGAQVQSPPVPVTPADYSKESAIIQSMHVAMRFENDGTGTREYSVQVRLQSEAGVQQYGLLTFGYSSANEQIEIPYVRVRKPDGTTVTTSAQDVQDMAAEITRVAPMYSDYREKHIAVKGLAVGDVLEYQVKTQTVKPLVPGQFWFDYTFLKSGIVLDEELELNLPKDRFVNVKSTDIKPSIKEEGPRRIYIWKTSNTVRKPDEDPEKETPPPPVQVSTFRSWEEVGNWWGALERERMTPTPEIRAKAAELTKGAKTDADKLKAIYNFVATRFRYISISFGIGRYQPHSADEVLKNAYGDCKDKHTLLASLLTAVGIKVYPALINSSLKIDPEVPSPGHFDHVISVIPQGKEWVWLDTTTEVAPFGMLMANLRDKEALVIPTDKAASLVKTPADPPFENSVVFDVEGKLDEAGTLNAKIQRTDRGDLEVIFRLAFRETPQANWKDLVQRISYASGFAGEVSDVTATSPEATDQPFRVSYNYVRKDYPDWANHRINPPTQLCSLPALNDKQLKSIEPLKLLGPAQYVCKSRIELPHGYTSQLLPPADIVRDFAEYHSTYSFKGGVFEAQRRIVIKFRELPANRRVDYQSLQKAASDDGNLYAVFALGTDDLLSRANQMSADDLNSAAATLLDQNKDFPTALVLLQKATAKDPHHKLAWNNLGRAYRAMGRSDEAEMAFKKQIEINPKDEFAYKNLGSLYTYKKRYDAALAIYQKYIEVNPNDKETYGYLGWTLGQMEKWDEAAQAYEKAAAMNPDKPYAYTQWGHMLLKAGKVEEARQKLERALEIDSSPMTLNNVAWELADAGVDLDKAEEEAKSAVDKTAESFAVPTSLQTPPDYTQRLGTLATYLDTLGWVFYQKGKLDEAEPYLLAANVLTRASLITEHVAQLRARQDRFEDALRYYAYEQMEYGWTGHSDKKLEDYLERKSGGLSQVLNRLAEIKKTFNDQNSLNPAQGSFTWPDDSKETKASFVEISVAADGSGAVTDAKILNGNSEFRNVALDDARHLRLPPIAWPGHALQTIRTITFLYRPPSLKSPEKRVKAWWNLGTAPPGYITVISPDEEHVFSVTRLLAAQWGKLFSSGANSDKTIPPLTHRSSDYTDSLAEGVALRRGRNLEGAISKFRDAIQADPNCVPCHGMLADTYAQKGDRASAIAEYKEVVRIEPDNPDSHFMLGVQFEADGATKAYANYHFDPKSRTNRPGSSTLSKTARADYESALEQYRLAHQLVPDNPNYKEAYDRLAKKLKHP